MRYVGVGNVTTAGLALALPVGWELWRAYARARIVSLCRTADRWDVAERRVWRQPSNASKGSSGSTAGLAASYPLAQDLSFALARRTADVRVHPQSANSCR